MTRPSDPADKNGHRPTIHFPSGKKYKGEWSGNKMHGTCENRCITDAPDDPGSATRTTLTMFP